MQTPAGRNWKGGAWKLSPHLDPHIVSIWHVHLIVYNVLYDYWVNVCLSCVSYPE